MLTTEQKQEIVEWCNYVYNAPDMPDGGSHACGGHLHIVLDDHNIEDHHIEYCIKSAKRDNCKMCETTGNIILKMSYLERARLVRGRYGSYCYNGFL